MKKKGQKKSSINVPGGQLPVLKRKLRVQDVFGLVRIGTLPVEELRKLGSDRRPFGLVLYNANNADTEQRLSFSSERLFPCLKVNTRQDKFQQAMDPAWKPEKKFYININAESPIQPSKPINT